VKMCEPNAFVNGYRVVKSCIMSHVAVSQKIRGFECKKDCKRLNAWSPQQASLLSVALLLVAYANEAGAKPHHEFGPGAVRLLLGIVRVGSRDLVKAISGWGRLRSSTCVISAKHATLLTLHSKIRLAALRSGLIACRRSAMAALNLAGLLLVSLLHLSDLLLCCLLLLRCFLLTELASCLLYAVNAIGCTAS